MLKETIRLAAILLTICGICTALVAEAFNSTKDTIENRAAQQIRDSYKQVLPDADIMTKQPPPDNAALLEVLRSESNGMVNGYIYMAAPSGYSGKITTMIGISHPSMRITGVKILQQTETPGLGAKCEESQFTQQFADKPLVEPLAVSKQAARPQEIQAITAATITSKAVVSGINAAREHYQQNYAVKP